MLIVNKTDVDFYLSSLSQVYLHRVSAFLSKSLLIDFFVLTNNNNCVRCFYTHSAFHTIARFGSDENEFIEQQGVVCNASVCNGFKQLE